MAKMKSGSSRSSGVKIAQSDLKIKTENAAAYNFISGATGYIGFAFCKELASRGENLFITGRSQQKLQEVAARLKGINADIKILYCACDLCDEKSRAELFAAAEKLTFSRVINVAGADIQKSFMLYDEQKIIFQSRILFEAALSLTRFCLDRRTERFAVINISSITGLYPMPYFALYSVLKGALINFSVALSRELKGSGVKVTAILPGAVYTRPDVIEYIKKQGVWGKIAAKSPEFIAKKSLKASKKGKVKYIPGAANRFMHFFSALIPQRIKLSFIARRWSKTQKDAF